MQPSQIPVDTRRSSNPLLDLVPIRPQPNRTDDGPSDFQKQLDDIRPAARPEPSKKSSPAPKNDKVKPRESRGDSRPADSDSDTPTADTQETPVATTDQSAAEQTVVIAANAEIKPAIDAAAQPANSTAATNQELNAGNIIPNKKTPSAEDRAIIPGDDHDATGKKFDLQEVKPGPRDPKELPVKPRKPAEFDVAKGISRARPTTQSVHVNPKVEYAEFEPNEDQSDESAPTVSVTRAGAVQNSKPIAEHTPNQPQSGKSDEQQTTDVSQNSGLHESITAANRASKRDLVSDAKDKLNSSKFAKTNDVEDANSSNAPRLVTTTPNPVVRIAQATGDETAASLGRWLVSAQTDKSEKRGESTSRFELSNVSDVTDKTSTSTPIATAKNSGAVPRSSEASPIAFRVAELLGADKPSVDNIDGLARSLSNLNGAGRHQVTLQLDPPELGRLRLDIRMEEGAMTLRVDAQSNTAAKLIESRMPDLRESLAVHGIRVDRTDIVVRSAESGQPSQDHNQPNQNSHSFGQQNANSDTSGRGWFSQADSNRDNDHSPWNTFATGTTDMNTSVPAEISSDPTSASSVFIQPSLNLVA